MSMFRPDGTPARTSASRTPTPSWSACAGPSRHEEPDRVADQRLLLGPLPERWRRELGLPADTDPYYHYDLDFIVTVPNMDPHIKPFETIREDDEEVVVRTGFETTIRKRFDLPMPEQVSWETDTIEKMEAFEFDDPADRRRFFAAGDNQIAGVGDGFERNSPPWVETVKSLPPGLPGLRQHHRGRRDRHPAARPAQHPDLDRRVPGALRGAAAAHRRVLPTSAPKAPIEAGRRAPRRLRDLGRRRLPQGHALHAPDLLARVLQADRGGASSSSATPTGSPSSTTAAATPGRSSPDMIEIGLDGYNPLEAKAGLDVVELRAAATATG